MTSPNFNIGFTNDRNSSRVLKPPGGGHTDIFNLKEDPAPAKDAGVKQGTAAAGVSTAHASQPKPEAQKQGRVPPGGFSSGLW